MKTEAVIKEECVEFRCKICSKLLAKKNEKGEIAGEIKCPRCGTINRI